MDVIGFVGVWIFLLDEGGDVIPDFGLSVM